MNDNNKFSDAELALTQFIQGIRPDGKKLQAAIEIMKKRLWRSKVATVLIFQSVLFFFLFSNWSDFYVLTIVLLGGIPLWFVLEFEERFGRWRGAIIVTNWKIRTEWRFVPAAQWSDEWV